MPQTSCIKISDQMIDNFMTQSDSIHSICEENNSIQEWVHRWGCSMSQMYLDYPCNIYRTPNIEGFIGYRIESKCAVVFGDPVCAVEQMPELAKAFQTHCQEQNQNTIYVIASEPFAKWAINNLLSVSIEVGEELFFDPQLNESLKGHKGYRLRNKLNYARKHGLEVYEYLSSNEDLEHAMQQVGNAWLQSRRGPQIHLGQLDFFTNRSGTRWFYLHQSGHIMGVALLCRLEARQGWFIKYLVVEPNSPRGSSELLMESILDTLEKEQCHFLTSGIIPSNQLGDISGLSGFSKVLARSIYKLILWIFKLNRRKEYWQKFHPSIERSFLLFSRQVIGLNEIRAIKKSLKISLK